MDKNCGQYDVSGQYVGVLGGGGSGCATSPARDYTPSVLDTLRCELRRKARQKTEEAVMLQQDADFLNKLAAALD